MKRDLMQTALLLAGMAALPAQAGTASQGLYISGGAGGNWMSGKADFAAMPDADPNYHANAQVFGALGYKWKGWRAEIEPAWMTSDVGLVGFKGGSTITAVLGNLAYDYALDDRWMLTGGAGVGGARVSHDIHTETTDRLLAGGHGGGLAWQLMAGVGYAVLPGVELGAEYRYMNTGDTGALSQYDRVRFRNGEDQAAMLTLRWHPFEDEAAAAAPSSPPPPLPPAPRPAAAAPRPLPPPVRTFVVFFDFDRTDLTEQARATIADAVRTAKENGFARVAISGHADRTGTGRYNARLSLRRAEVVKAAMVGLGLAPDAIATIGKSFSQPLVPTGPGVREPQNRRAVIDLGG